MSGRSRVRTCAAAVGVLGVLALALLPAQHVHDLAHDGHHAELIHRHFEAHHSEGGPAHFDDDDDDGEVRWLTSVFVGPDPVPLIHAVHAELTPHIDVPPVMAVRTHKPIDLAVHDPPWATSLSPRAPPPLSS